VNDGGVPKRHAFAVRERARQAVRVFSAWGKAMQNELDGRLGRLEAAVLGQRDLLEGQGARQEEMYQLLVQLVSLVTRPAPSGPPLHELLAQLIAMIAETIRETAGNREQSKRTLAAIERLERLMGGKTGSF
jgi:ABC-type transporter Mla subunit MlaD